MERLGGARMTDTETGLFTHVIMHVDGKYVKKKNDDDDGCVEEGRVKRTSRYYHGLLHGAWIVRYAWIVESEKCGRWVPEDAYQVQCDDQSQAVHVPHKARRAMIQVIPISLSLGDIWVCV